MEPYRWVVVKMTMQIDADVLARVMKITGAETKTAAVETALNEMARRHKMKELFASGLGLTPDELRTAFDPGSYPEQPSIRQRVAEDPEPHAQPDPA